MVPLTPHNKDYIVFDASVITKRVQDGLRKKGNGLKGFFADDESTKQPYLERRPTLLEVVTGARKFSGFDNTC